MYRISFKFVRFYSYNISNITKSAGFQIQVHKTISEDGYILVLHRIVDDRNGNSRFNKSPVLLQHGLWSSSDDWLLPGPHKSLGLMFARQGFDVWLGNTRANQYSTRHVRLSADKSAKQFYDFSWHEMGVYDLPAMIDYILRESSRSSLYYVGHSQGTTVFFVMCSERKDMNEKVKAMLALAPVVYLKHVGNRLLQNLAPFSNVILRILDTTGNYKIPQDALVYLIQNIWSVRPRSADILVDAVLKALSFYATDEVKLNMKHIIMSHISSGTSSKVLAHYGQCMQREKCFQHFDYGPEKNVTVYGQVSAPSYNLNNITVPVIVFYSEHDWLADPKDIESFVQNLTCKVIIEKVNIPNFSHHDFLFADVRSLDWSSQMFNYLETYEKIDL